MEDNQESRLERVKRHLKENKTAYIAGATGVSCLAIGGGIGLAISKADVKQFVDSLKLVHFQYKSPNVNIALVKNACPDPIPVLDKSTGIPYASMKQAAKLTGEAYHRIRNDVHGENVRWDWLPESVFA